MKINPLLSLFIVQNQSFKDYFRIMKISLFLLFACALQLLAVNTEAQNAVITFPSNSISVGQLIEEIEKQTDYLVVYSNREIDTNRQVTIQNKSAKVSSYLKETLAEVGIGYKFENDYIILSKNNSLLAHQLPVCRAKSFYIPAPLGRVALFHTQIQERTVTPITQNEFKQVFELH